MSIAADRLPTPRRAPKIVIELQIEAAPRVRVDAANDEDFDRLADWIKSNEAIHQLIVDAREIHAHYRGVQA